MSGCVRPEKDATSRRDNPQPVNAHFNTDIFQELNIPLPDFFWIIQQRLQLPPDFILELRNSHAMGFNITFNPLNKLSEG